MVTALILHKYFLQKFEFLHVHEDVFCAFKGFYCLDLHFGVKDLFMHKKHSLHALNIKITIMVDKELKRVLRIRYLIKLSFSISKNIYVCK
jgi:hypothetical protein